MRYKRSQPTYGINGQPLDGVANGIESTRLGRALIKCP
jgi:hypothetical protein